VGQGQAVVDGSRQVGAVDLPLERQGRGRGGGVLKRGGAPEGYGSARWLFRDNRLSDRLRKPSQAEQQDGREVPPSRRPVPIADRQSLLVGGEGGLEKVLEVNVPNRVAQGQPATVSRKAQTRVVGPQKRQSLHLQHGGRVPTRDRTLRLGRGEEGLAVRKEGRLPEPISLDLRLEI